ncbi:MAG: LytTR family transcriptional regulator DNA-binding domain-containing protein [Leadbetterella sp.]
MKTRQTFITKNHEIESSPFVDIHVGSRQYVRPAEIILIVAEISYSIIYLVNGKKILVSTNIKKLDERLHTFRDMIRVHRSYLINTQHLLGIEGNHALLKNNLGCTISRRKHKDLNDSFKI